MTDLSTAVADELGVRLPLTDPDSDAANVVADALTDLLAEVCEDGGGDWRQLLSWAYDERTAVKPSDPRAEKAAALIALLPSGEDGETRIMLVRRAVRNFRSEHLDPTMGWVSADATAEELAEKLGIEADEAKLRVAAVAWEGLNPTFWG